jgi:hypothetical protein
MCPKSQKKDKNSTEPFEGLCKTSFYSEHAVFGITEVSIE